MLAKIVPPAYSGRRVHFVPLRKCDLAIALEGGEAVLVELEDCLGARGRE